MAFASHGINARIGTASPRKFLERFRDAHLFVIERDRARAFRGESQSFGKSIDCDHAFRAEQIGAPNREKTDWATAPDRHGIARLNVAILRGHISRRENVREKEHLL